MMALRNQILLIKLSDFIWRYVELPIVFMVSSQLASSCLSVCPQEKLGSHGQIFMKFRICVFFEKFERKFKFNENLTRMTVTLHKDQYTYVITYCSVFLRNRNVSGKVLEKIKTLLLLRSKAFFFSE
jgi:hypothetical protein